MDTLPKAVRGGLGRDGVRPGERKAQDGRQEPCAAPSEPAAPAAAGLRAWVEKELEWGLNLHGGMFSAQKWS